MLLLRQSNTGSKYQKTALCTINFPSIIAQFLLTILTLSALILYILQNFYIKSVIQKC